MPQRAVTIESLPAAFEVVPADGLDWGEGYRPLGRRALAGIEREPGRTAEPGTGEARGKKR